MSSLLFCSMMFFVAGSAFAKPGADQDGPYVGNDMPSGPHANLNIHGKDPAKFVCPQQTTDGGFLGYWKPVLDENGVPIPGEWKLDTSIFMPEHSDDAICNGVPQTIVIQSGKKHGNPKKGGEPVDLPDDQIIVTDACTQCIDGDAAEFKLPPCEAGYKVYGRALGKPSEDPEHIRKIIISAGDLLTATDGNEQDLLELGEIIGNTITPSTASPVEATRQRGKPKTVPLSDLFKFTGTICYLVEPDGWDTLESCPSEIPTDWTGECKNAEVDICATDYEGDGIYDVIVLRDETNGCPVWEKWEVEDDVWVCYLDRNFNGSFDVVDEESVPSAGEFDDDCPTVDELTAYCKYYQNVWIFNIADLVEYYFGVENDGVKLFQIRFYPIDPECFTSSS